MKKNVVYKAIDIIIKTMLTLFIIIALILTFFLLQSKVDGRVPSISGYQLYIVMSGSMSPTVNTGSLVAVKPLLGEEIQPEDIITFRGEVDNDNITTHRVVAKGNDGEIVFTTKGDANEVEDPMPVAAHQVIGKVIAVVPYAGYAFYYAKTQSGIKILAGLIALLMVFSLAELSRTYLAKRKKKGVLDKSDEGVGVKEKI